MMTHAMPTAVVLAAILVATAAPSPPAKVTARAVKPHATPAAASPAGRDAAARPDFTGRWTLDMKTSEFGTLPGGKPLARTDTITHREPDIAHVLFLENPASRDTAVYRYRTTGEPTHSTIDSRDVQSVARWEGRTLVIDSKMKMMIFDVTLNDRWDLSVNRDTLKMTRRVKSPLGASDQRLIFLRR